MSREHIVIDDTSVRESIPLIEQSEILLNSALKEIESSKNNLDYKIKYKIGGYSDVKLKLTDAIQLTKTIINKSKTFLENYDENIYGAKNLMNSASDEKTSIKLESNSIPFTSQSNNGNDDVADSAIIAAALLSLGISHENVARVINGETTIEELFDEMVLESDKEYVNMKAQELLQQYQYSSEDTSRTLTKAKNELSDLENEYKDVTVQWNKAGYAGKDVSELAQRKTELESAIKDKKKEVLTISKVIEARGEVDFNFNSMEEVNKAIEECQNTIVDLASEYGGVDNLKYLRNTLKKLETSMTSDISYGYVLSYDKVKGSYVAYKYTDENSNIVYDFGSYDHAITMAHDASKVEPISYEDMLGDSVIGKKISNISNVLSGNEEIDTSLFSDEEINELINYFKKSYSDLDFDETGSSKEVLESLIEAVIEEDGAIGKGILLNSFFNFLRVKIEPDVEAINAAAKKINAYENIKNTIEAEIKHLQENVFQIMSRDDFNAYATFNSEKYQSVYNGEGLKLDGLNNLYEESREEVLKNKNLYLTLGLLSILSHNNDNLPSVFVNIMINVMGTESRKEFDKISHFDTLVDYMTQDEIKVLTYLSNKSIETGNYEELYMYIDKISHLYDQRVVSAYTKRDEEYATDNAFLASVGSVFLKPIEGINGFLTTTTRLMQGLEIWRSQTYSIADTYRQTVSSNINILHGGTAAFFYNIGMSMADSGLVIVLTAISGGGSLVYSIGVMGSSVFLSTFNEALDRGVDPGTAYGFAVVAAGIESLMENYSVAHLLGLEESAKTFAKKSIYQAIVSKVEKLGFSSATSGRIVSCLYGIISQALVEGDEEACTEILDKLAEELILNDKGELAKAVEQYKKEHPVATDDEILAYELNLIGGSISEAWLGGVVSGLGFGAAGSFNFQTQEAQNMYNQYLLSMIQLKLNNQTNISTNSQENISINNTQDFMQQLFGPDSKININGNNCEIVFSDNTSTTFEIDNTLFSADTIWYPNEQIRKESLTNLLNHLSKIDAKSAARFLAFLSSKNMQSYYEEAYNQRTPNIKGASVLDTFRTHGLGHVIEVTCGAIDTYEVLCQLDPRVKNSNMLDTMIVAGLCHDTGMARGYMIMPGVNADGTANIKWVKNEAYDGVDTGFDITRPNHSSMSALDTLLLGEDIKKCFPDVDVVDAALSVFVHSKSNSGVVDLSAEASWSRGVQTFEALIQQYNADNTDHLITFTHNGNTYTSLVEYLMAKGDIVKKTGTTDFNFKGVKYYDEAYYAENSILYETADVNGTLNVYEFSKNFLSRMGYNGLAIRLGDANTNNLILQMNQNGKVIAIKKGTAQIVPLLGDCEYYKNDKKITGLGKVIEARAKAELKSKDWYTLDGNEHSAGNVFIIGESNQLYRVEYEAGSQSLCEVISIVDSNTAPAATIFAAHERFGEINSSGDLLRGHKKYIIELKGDASEYTQNLYKDYMKNLSNEIKKAGITIELKVDGKIVETYSPEN